MIAQADLARFKELLEQKRSFLVLIPQNPDMDAVSAGLSLYLALGNQGKEASIACPTPMRVEFNRLVGVNRIRENVGDRNLNISFENFEAGGIEKVSYDIDNGKFNLKVVPKPGYSAPAPEQVKIEYAGAAAEAVIVVKVEKKQDLGKFAENEDFFLNTQTVLVSNLPSQGFQSPIEVVDPRATSCSEVVFQIVENWGWQIDADLAGNLFMGLRAGTNNFQNGNVSSETFAIASKLMRSGAKMEPQFQGQPVPQQNQPFMSPGSQQGQGQEPPQDWLQPKVYKGSKLP